MTQDQVPAVESVQLYRQSAPAAAKMKVWSSGLLAVLALALATEPAQQQQARRPKQLGLSEPEQKYDLELSFPIDSDEATNDEGRRQRIDELIQAILSNEELVSGLNILPMVSQYYVHSLARRGQSRGPQF